MKENKNLDVFRLLFYGFLFANSNILFTFSFVFCFSFYTHLKLELFLWKKHTYTHDSFMILLSSLDFSSFSFSNHLCCHCHHCFFLSIYLSIYVMFGTHTHLQLTTNCQIQWQKTVKCQVSFIIFFWNIRYFRLVFSVVVFVVFLFLYVLLNHCYCFSSSSSSCYKNVMWCIYSDCFFLHHHHHHHHQGCLYREFRILYP